ncbi:hypothetical protein [Mycobacterium sp.]|nr:hypothetical protein [Mycobacterium sp.]
MKRYVDFPEPDVIAGRTQGWSRDAINAWLADHPHIGAKKKA